MLALLTLWGAFSVFLDAVAALNLSIAFVAPHILLSLPAFFSAGLLVLERVWRFSGIYRLLGVQGWPIRDKITGNMKGSSK